MAAHSSSPLELKARIEAERRGAPFVEYRDGEGRQVIVDLGGGEPVRTIGRREGSDVMLGWDPEVSRLHAMLERAGEEWTVVDDGLSANGSFVNGRRVTHRQRLRDGDELCFGATHMTFRRPARDGARSTVVVQSGAAPPAVSEAQRKVLIALCRPLKDPGVTTPATNREIAEELVVSVDTVKAHLRTLFDRFELDELPQNQKRAQLAAAALLRGVVKPHEL